MSIYINQEPKYCTYLTVYSGNKLPPFYIGSGTISKIQNKVKPYRGSVASKKYKTIWETELKHNPQLFKTIILEKFYSRNYATKNELILQKRFDVIRSPQFINMAWAAKNFADGRSPSEETKKKMSEAKRPPLTKEHRNIISKAQKGKKKPPRTEEYKRNMSMVLSGGRNPNAIPVTINQIVYPSKIDAMKGIGLSLYKLNKLLSNIVFEN